MSVIRAGLTGLLFFMVGGCRALLLPTSLMKQIPFVHSSLDFNNGTPSTIVLKDRKMDDVISRITKAAEKRSYTILKRGCHVETCKVVYKKTSTAKSKIVGSGGSIQGTGQTNIETYELELSARLFATLKASDSSITVEIMGVPVVNETLSCPYFLAKQKECETQMFNVMGNDTPAQSFKAKWGVNISGKSEFEDIGGIFAELQS